MVSHINHAKLTLGRTNYMEGAMRESFLQGDIADFSHRSIPGHRLELHCFVNNLK
jgi:hypothetical protein